MSIVPVPALASSLAPFLQRDQPFHEMLVPTHGLQVEIPKAAEQPPAGVTLSELEESGG